MVCTAAKTAALTATRNQLQVAYVDTHRHGVGIGSAPRAIRAPHEERSQTLPSKRRRVVCGSDARRDIAPGSQLPSDEELEPYILQVEGRSFMCTLCGKCCTGKGEVRGLPPRRGVLQHVKRKDGSRAVRWVLPSLPLGEGCCHDNQHMNQGSHLRCYPSHYRCGSATRKGSVSRPLST